MTDTKVDQIADRIYRLSTFVPEIGPTGFTFNQFLVDAEEPLLFHCGQRSLFPSISAAAARVLDLGRLRWITFSHVEADESGMQQIERDRSEQCFWIIAKHGLV